MTSEKQFVDGQFCWIELKTRDIEDSTEFYNQLFGWDYERNEHEDGYPTGHFSLLQQSVAALGKSALPKSEEPATAVWHGHIQVADIDQSVALAVQLGATVEIPVSKVDDEGWTASIQDPMGARVGLWQGNRFHGADLMHAVHACCWHDLCARDARQSQQFYGSLFGWLFQEQPMPIAEYHIIENQNEQNGGVLVMDERWGTMRPCWLPYFAVENVDFSADFVRQIGGSVFVQPFDIPEGRLAMVTDRQGALFNLVQASAEHE